MAGLKALIRRSATFLVNDSKHGGRRKKDIRYLESLDDDARKTVLATKEFTLLNSEKLYSLIQSVRYIHRCSIPGDIVECGVWRGGAIMAAALTLKQLNASRRKFYLYDTFTGMTRPTVRDGSLPGTRAVDVAARFQESQDREDSSAWCHANLADVRNNLRQVPCDQDDFVFVKGKVEETLKSTRPESIAVLRLDTDWFESTRCEMKYLMPLLVPRGVLIIDDYYRWKGNRDAVDEYIARHNIPILLTRVGNSAVGVLPC